MSEKLEKSEYLLKKAQEIAHIGSWKWDIKTGELQWSDEIYRIFGFRPQEFPATYDRFISVIHPEDRKLVLDAVNECRANVTSTYSVVHRLVTPDSNIKHVKAQGEVICNEAGVPVFMIGTVLDVTETWKSEQMLMLRSDELKRSNQELEHFAYVASHDLQEPLRMVSSYLGLVEQRYNDRLDDDGREFIHYAVDGARRMQELIQALLVYSRVNSKKGPHVCINVNGLIESVLKDLELAIRESQATVNVGRLPEIIGDEKQIRQLFQNIISNAIKYRGNTDPLITIEVKTVSELKISPTKAGMIDGWIFVISDNGIGFKEEFRERIFDIFERLHTRQDYPGAGIGLSICRRTVENHGGRIWAESEFGKGARFYFSFPYVQDEKKYAGVAG